MRPPCKNHPSETAIAACALCGDRLCASCVAFAVGDRGAACQACGAAVIAEARTRSALSLLLVAAGYLGIVALGTLILKASPTPVGVAALAAVFLSRLLPLRPGIGHAELRGGAAGVARPDAPVARDAKDG